LDNKVFIIRKLRGTSKGLFTWNCPTQYKTILRNLTSWGG